MNATRYKIYVGKKNSASDSLGYAHFDLPPETTCPKELAKQAATSLGFSLAAHPRLARRISSEGVIILSELTEVESIENDEVFDLILYGVLHKVDDETMNVSVSFFKKLLDALENQRNKPEESNQMLFNQKQIDKVWVDGHILLSKHNDK